MTRPKQDKTDRVYKHFSTEKSANYLFIKTISVSNTDIKISPFIPPQLYKRFVDLCCTTFEARKANQSLKTQISIGEEDLLLLVKMKGDKEWEVKDNLEAMGPISSPQWHKL